MGLQMKLASQALSFPAEVLESIEQKQAYLLCSISIPDPQKLGESLRVICYAEIDNWG